MPWCCVSSGRVVDGWIMLIIHNAQIYTLDDTLPTAHAIAIDRGWIVACGSDDEVLSAFPRGERKNAEGHTIIPGLVDAHIHLEEYALSLKKIDCEVATRQECLVRVAAQASKVAPGKWILGHGWNQNNWAEGYGTAAMLDEIAPHNPVWLTHKSLHSGWANTQALKLAGIKRNTSDPAGGRISRLPSGEPDGILFESASEMLEEAIPAASLEEVVNALRTALPGLHKMGLTGVHDFDGSRCFSALQVLHANGELKMRVVKGIRLENLSQAAELGLRSGFGNDYLYIGPLKLFSDGALGPHTAAMFLPYEDESSNRGILMMDAEQIFEVGRLAVEHGIGLAVHAIGDRANHEVLNAFAHLRQYEQHLPIITPQPLRHRIEHVQVVHPDDLPRFAQLGIIASMQPIHATSDMYMADRCWGARSAYAYAWRSQLDHHNTLAFGSDAPVESPNPFWGIHAAVTRRRADGSPAEQGWHPEQRLSVGEAIRSFTTGAAYAAKAERQLGMIAPGYLADLVVLDNDPYSCEPDALKEILPLATMVGGEWVYSML
jgi:predicted amidohydrolase YtcJ